MKTIIGTEATPERMFEAGFNNIIKKEVDPTINGQAIMFVAKK